ncbi:IS3 family transposase [Bifidobacterium subtile]|jgi:transposase InsO family protein|nr:IS3 family transposase [Bifidobacterium subtile]
MIAYIDAHRARFGVEPICRTLRASLDCGFLTPRAYWQSKARAVSRMRARHEAMTRDIAVIHAHRFMAVYGYRKMHAQLIRQGWDGIGRDQVLRVMRSTGIRGVRRGRIPVATKPVRSRGGREDLVQRRFTADAPGRLHVADITYVRLASGSFAYVAFVTDAYARRIVGWAVSSSQRTRALPLVALDQSIAWTARHGDTRGLIHHSDHGTQYISSLYGTHLNEAGILASTGTVGDSYDNALAESVNGAYKNELITRSAPFGTVRALETATFQWVSWWNNQRLHERLDYRTPAEVEARYYQTKATPVTQ